MIPDLADLEDEEVIATVAAPPSVNVNRIQTISELESDLHDQLGVTAQVYRPRF
jgi:hypothetical protein